MDHELHPHRVIVGTENRPPSIAATGNWCASTRTCSATSRGPVGTTSARPASDGASPVRIGELGGFMGEYPWLTANCGDFDITGHRRPVSYWREIVWGLRAEPYVAVRPPAHHGEATSAGTGWSFTDAIASWSWPGFEDRPVTVEVYADADEVELLVNGTSVGRAAAGEDHRYRAVFETTYAPGELTAVAYRDGAETGRRRWSRRAAPVLLDVRVDRARDRRRRPRPRVRRDRAGRRRRQRALRRGPRGDRRGRRPRRCSRASAAATRAPRRPSARRRTTPTTGARSRSSARPTRARSPSRCRRRTATTARDHRGRDARDLGAALAPVPG